MKPKTAQNIVVFRGPAGHRRCGYCGAAAHTTEECYWRKLAEKESAESSKKSSLAA